MFKSILLLSALLLSLLKPFMCPAQVYTETTGQYKIPICIEDSAVNQEPHYVHSGKVFDGFYLFYKKHISSNDATSCNFEPSCSSYCIDVIGKYGFILGAMATFDRLARCNGLNGKEYERDKKTGKLIDYP